MERDFCRELDAARALAEARLGGFFPGGGLQEAMRYSLLAGGKRVRPVLTMKFCQAAGGKMEDALDFGCGVEMIHTYSLIHDDLPCMDNDDLRRGKPTCHKVFGECVATLAGDALQPAAFQTVLQAQGPWTGRNTAVSGFAAGILAEAAGEAGMCGGQYEDTVGNGRPHTEPELTAIHDRKTGALLRAACMMGVAAAGSCDATDDRMNAAKAYATHLGLAFQIRDDILDAVSTTAALGKTVGSDAANRKSTYVTLLGLDACEDRVRTETARAKAALAQVSWPGGTDFLLWFADRLAERTH